MAPLSITRLALQQMATADGITCRPGGSAISELDCILPARQGSELQDALAAYAAGVEYYNGALLRLDALMKARQSLGQLEDAVEDPSALSDKVIEAAQSPSFSHEE